MHDTSCKFIVLTLDIILDSQADTDAVFYLCQGSFAEGCQPGIEIGFGRDIGKAALGA